MRRPWRTLRGRLALLTAAAVALAVSAACVAAYALVRQNLTHEIDTSLRRLPVARVNQPLPPPRTPTTTVTPRSLQFDLQILNADGTVAGSLGAARLPVTSTDRTVARGGGDRLYETHDSDGTHVRVLVRHVSTGGAVMVARPLSETDRTLAHLGLLLVLVAEVGVLGAAAVGLLVARAGMRPVDRLTEAAERIARTQRTEPPLPVHGSDELSRLGRAFNAMVSALAASRDQQRHLILDAGHELRTPVTVLQTNIELLRRAEAHPERLPADQRAALFADLDAQSSELADLVGDIIHLARDDTDNIQHVPVKIAAVIRRAVDRAKLRAGPGVDFDVDTDDTTVVGDPATLERAVVNVLDNAVKFGPPTQTVRVRLAAGVVTVSDEGPGIAEEDRPHVFDRFYRAATSRQLPGSGLGLAIVARAAELHGATVTLGIGAAGGSVITVDFRPGAARQPGLTDTIEQPQPDRPAALTEMS